MGKKRTYQDMLNLTTFNTLYQHYRNLAVNMFKWDGLPEGIEEIYIERLLFDEGKALFVEDKTAGFYVLEAQQGAQLNVYNEPLSWRAVGNGYNKVYLACDCVLIENNKQRTPSHDIVAHFVRKLYEAERTMDTNLTTSKMPWFFLCDEKKVLTYKALFQKIDNNEPAIFGTRDLLGDSVQLLPTRVQFLGNELMDFEHSIENRMMTFLGINNTPVDKKERLVTDEAEANNQLLDSNASIMLEARERAVEKINKKYGLSITVELRNKREVEEDVSDESISGEDKPGNG